MACSYSTQEASHGELTYQFSPECRWLRKVSGREDIDLQQWTPVRVWDMGCHQCTPSSNSTTLESNMSPRRRSRALGAWRKGRETVWGLGLLGHATAPGGEHIRGPLAPGCLRVPRCPRAARGTSCLVRRGRGLPPSTLRRVPAMRDDAAQHSLGGLPVGARFLAQPGPSLGAPLGFQQIA